MIGIALAWLRSGGWKIAFGIGMALAVLFYRGQANKWHNAFDAQRSAYIAASAQAETAHIAAKATAEASYRTKARFSDERHQTALARANSASERFIAAGGVRRACDQRAPGGAASPAPGGGSSGVDGTSSTSELVAVTPDDVRICTTNTTRLEAAREWALELND